MWFCRCWLSPGCRLSSLSQTAALRSSRSSLLSLIRWKASSSSWCTASCAERYLTSPHYICRQLLLNLFGHSINQHFGSRGLITLRLFFWNHHQPKLPLDQYNHEGPWAMESTVILKWEVLRECMCCCFL